MKNNKLIIKWLIIGALFLGLVFMDGILLPLIISSSILPLGIIIVVGGIAIAFSFALIITIAHRIAVMLDKDK